MPSNSEIIFVKIPDEFTFLKFSAIMSKQLNKC